MTDPAKQPQPNDEAPKARQPDGTDSSKQMEAGVADENMIPETAPE